MLTLAAKSREPVEPTELLSLAAMGHSLFISVVLESRQLGDVKKCHKLWTETAQFFEELCWDWAGIDAAEANIVWLLAKLQRYRDLARERVSIYTVNESARRAYNERKAADSEYSFQTRGEIAAH